MCHYVGDVLFVFVCVCFYSAQLTIFIYHSGKNCSTSVSACASDVEFCRNGGTCSYNSAGEVQCICPPGIEACFKQSIGNEFVKLNFCFDIYLSFAL